LNEVVRLRKLRVSVLYVALIFVACLSLMPGDLTLETHGVLAFIACNPWRTFAARTGLISCPVTAVGPETMTKVGIFGCSTAVEQILVAG
jgi:hypothetical protein